MKSRLFLAGVLSATMVTTVAAQPATRDHRDHRDRSTDRDHRDATPPVRDHRDPHDTPPPPPVTDTHDTHDTHDTRDMHDDHHRQWKLERPVVSSYWPQKGKAGSRVVIRGQNFDTGTTVLWGDTPIAGAQVSPTEITFIVPAGAASGALALSGGSRGRNLPIGSFDVADYDADAALRRAEDERRHNAEAVWAERQKQLAKDETTRRADLNKHHDERASTREDRRRARETEIRSKWDHAFLTDPETQAELTLHAQRLAQIERMRELAEAKSNGKLVVRIEMAQTKENQRHEDRMAALHNGFGK
ncbi:MAG: hypothetical protein JWO36_6624 [Myxococcales bacterium]|nr:hypothetical protein [Myxococcales bacterium]